RALGHPCTKFTNAGVSLTSDPFFYPAFLKSWFPLPDNRHLLPKALDSDYIYISHAHEDHFDREFLKRVDTARTTIIVPRFRSSYLWREVVKLGFEPVVLGHGETCELPGDILITMLIDRSHKADSALLVDCGGFRFLNSNDCELAIPDWPTGVDLLACQFSGAFWYPHCYDFDHRQQFTKAQEVRKNNLERLYRRVNLTGARSYLPSAGPAVFLDPALMQYNRHGGIFQTWEEVAWGFSDEFPDRAIWPYLNNPVSVKEYSGQRRGEWGAYYSMPDSHVTEEELNCHFRALQSFNKRFLRDWHKDVVVSFPEPCSASPWERGIRLGLLADELEEAFNPEYFLSVPPRVLRAVV